MPFTAPLPTWNNPGQKPPDSTIERGWGAGEYPPADWFNWHWYTTYKAIEEIQNLAATTTDLANHTKDNVRHITASERLAWNAKETPAGAQTKVDEHENKENNPHNVTASQVGAYSKTESDDKYETPTGAQSKANQAETNAKSYADGKVRGGKIQSGRVTMSIPGNSLKTITVTFPEGFSGTPVVTASINNSLSPDKYPAPTIGVVTTTSFQITGQNTSSGALTFDYGWIAMG
ncbi:H-type lectin domain-containing protein [Priestia filamentosa]|uniref:hypothetical protein n=1 Tax=Priestia filamentosa TaxID=1402861 RepID=UPI00398262A4